MNPKTSQSRSIVGRLLKPGLVIAAVAAAALVSIQRPAKADNTSPYGLAPQQPNFYRKDTAAFPAILTNSGNIAITGGSTNSLKLTLRQGKGLSIFCQLGTTNATTGSLTLKWDTTPDGTNFTTTQPITWVITPGNTATSVLAWTNFPPSFLDNVRAVQLTAIVNTFTNYWWGTNLWYSYSGQ